MSKGKDIDYLKHPYQKDTEDSQKVKKALDIINEAKHKETNPLKEIISSSSIQDHIKELVNDSVDKHVRNSLKNIAPETYPLDPAFTPIEKKQADKVKQIQDEIAR